MTPQVQSRGVLDKRGAHQRFTTPPQFIEPIINEILRNHHSKGRNSDIQNNNKGLHGPSKERNGSTIFPFVISEFSLFW